MKRGQEEAVVKKQERKGKRRGATRPSHDKEGGKDVHYHDMS